MNPNILSIDFADIQSIESAKNHTVDGWFANC